MNRVTRKRIILAGIGLLVLAVVVYGFLPNPLPVQTATVERGALQVIVEEEGETRVQDRYVISSPVSAFVRRIELEAGDSVVVGQPVVRLEPPRATAFDSRLRAEGEARVDAASAAVQQAAVAAERAEAERGRMERLHAGGAATQQALEQAVAEAARANASLDAARAELAAARAALSDNAVGDGPPLDEDVLRSPVAGRVLRVHQRSEIHVNPGQPLVDVGDANRLQIWTDVLSQDAVRIRPGTPVLVDQWGGGAQLKAVVTRVEPEGFTRVSALGVEERRVPVIADLVSPHAAKGLGSGYRVLTRFIVWEGRDVTRVPTSALFRSTDGWAVFVIEDSRAVRREVEVGQQAGLVAQVTAGLEPGDTVVIHPPNELESGVRVTAQGG